MSANRTFNDNRDPRGPQPLLLGIVGPSSSGKTYTALRLAFGMQRVIGGDVFFINTEGRRGNQYRDFFPYRHVQFDAPFGPLDYLKAIEHCETRGGKIVVIDQMTHEHQGEGGVMDQSEKFLDARCGEDWDKRNKMLMLSLVRPKQQRKKLNAYIVQSNLNMILCYRAADKIKPVPGKEPSKLGWQPETTSTLHYDMTQRFLLTPGCEGRPRFFPDNDAEKFLVKNPVQFKDWFKDGLQLSEDVGERMARWAQGVAPDVTAATITAYESCTDHAAFLALEDLRKLTWNNKKPDEQKRIKAAVEAARKRLEQRPTAKPDEPPRDELSGKGDAYEGDHTLDLPGDGALFGQETGVAH